MIKCSQEKAVRAKVIFMGILQVFFHVKELGPRTANMALSICLKLKMIEKVLKSDYLADEYLLILYLRL